MYFQNDVESRYFPGKRSKNFKMESDEISIKSLSKIAECKDLKEAQAIFHGGRYAPFQPYKKFTLESSAWHSRPEARCKDQIKRFCQYVPLLSDETMKRWKKPGKHQSIWLGYPESRTRYCDWQTKNKYYKRYWLRKPAK